MLAAVVLAAATSAAPPPRSDLQVAWLRDGRVERRDASPAAAVAEPPLGSLWKLFVYAYAVEKAAPTPAYRCGAVRRPGEEYCCEPGQSVERDVALARSCSPFFDPQRLGIGADDWRAFWSPKAEGDAAWLTSLERVQPATRVPVPQILHAVAAVPEGARRAAARALLPVVLDGIGQGAVSRIGGGLRVKTFTWPHPARAKTVIGGGAGWLVDGTPVWYAATGSSRSVLQGHADALASTLPAPRAEALGEACVVVDFFARYPIRAVDRMPARETARAGVPRGAHRVTFENGNVVTFEADGTMALDRDGERPRLRGRFGLSEYVARVLDREADPTATEAARALAVVARTWLLENAAFEGGCFRVADSTQAQRVSPSPATDAARGVALFTDGLILRGASVRYHRDTELPGTLSWAAAVQQARGGRRFDAILARAFPRTSLASETGEQECRTLPEAETWLARAIPGWDRRLAREDGFEPPERSLAVCALDYGHPYADRARARVYLRGLRTSEDRTTLAHEYVHLGFRYHPNGADESFVERLARALTEG